MNYIAITIKSFVFCNPLREKFEVRRRMKENRLRVAKIERKREIDALILRALELCKGDKRQREYISCVGAYFDRENSPQKCDIGRMRVFLESVGVRRSGFQELHQLLEQPQLLG